MSDQRETPEQLYAKAERYGRYAMWAMFAVLVAQLIAIGARIYVGDQ